MNDILKKASELIKKPKIWFITGIIGIFLIFLSSLFGNDKSDKEYKSTSQSTVSIKEYKNELESEVAEIAKKISGDKNATVVITLESGVRYYYADSLKSDSSNSANKDSKQESESHTKEYITVKSSDGGENPLVITEYMPKIRGVAVICENGEDDGVKEMIEDAVTAALNITSNRVSISGGIE